MSENRMREALERAIEYIEEITEGSNRGDAILMFLREALSPPARRTSYEWEFRELRYRCSWNGVDWSIYVFNPRLESWVWLPRAAAAAAIATLAGLTPPEEK